MLMVDEHYFPIHADGLTSKWGFGDGDSLDDVVWDICDELELDKPDRDEFLHKMVTKYLLPELDKMGVTYKIHNVGTCHNPVRAYEINGEDVSDYHYDPSYKHPLVGDVVVWLSKQQIIQAIKDN